MKKIALSLATVLTLSSVVIASDTTSQVKNDNGLYLGLGYGYLDGSIDAGSISTDIDTNNVVIQGGFKINKYVSLEARYWTGLDNGDATQSGGNYPGSYNANKTWAWGAYIKPTYPIFTNVNVYGLLGYGVSSLKYNGNSINSDDFSWGLGGEFVLNKNIAFYADYISITSQNSADFTYAPSGYTTSTNSNTDVYTMNIGITYKF
jgi:hypothetical protein